MVVNTSVDVTKRQVGTTCGDSSRYYRFGVHLLILLAFVFLFCRRTFDIIFVIVSSCLFHLLGNLIQSFHHIISHRPKTIYVSFTFLQLLTLFTLSRFFLEGGNELRLPGVIPPPRGFPGGSSGDVRVLVGPTSIVPAPYSQDVGSVITAAANAAVHGSYITGDDVSVIIPVRDESAYISKTIIFTYETVSMSALREIIVVDDASKEPIADFLDRELPPYIRRLVRVIRFDTKEGLIRARIAGADMAVASNLFFLDGHCRPKPNWFPPLLQHLKTNYKRLACPVVEDIDKVTWEDKGTFGLKMMFEWTFEFGWYDDPLDEVPISAGGIFAMTKKWWTESGKYDPGMLEWGGENLEQSMRVWMCGGEIYVVRDSKVGHIFDRPAKPNPGNKLVTQVQKNQKRAALVWLDDYYQYFEHFHSVVKTLDEGPNLQERIALRHSLNCRPFQWYVQKFRTSFERKGLLVYNYHHIQHLRSRWCLTGMSKNSDVPTQKLTLEPCIPDNIRQKWSIVGGNRMLQVQHKHQCIQRSSSLHLPYKEAFPTIVECDFNGVFQGSNMRQFWQFDAINSQRIFSYATKDLITLTGNDDFVINSDIAASSSSTCLAADLAFWNADFEASSANLYVKNGRYPNQVYPTACTNSTHSNDWADPLSWAWLW